MTCDEANTRLTALIDGELAPAELALVEGHLRQCAACSRVQRELVQAGLLADAWSVEGGDVWENVRQETSPDLTDLLAAIRSLQGDVQALRAEVADLRRQLAVRPTAPRSVGSLFPDVTGRQAVRPLI